MTIPYPDIGPVALQIGPLPLRWYSLAYIGGLAVGWWYAARLLRTTRLWPTSASVDSAVVKTLGKKERLAAPRVVGGPPLTRVQLDDLIFWVAAGVMLGGRLGYILFYEPSLLVAPFVHLGADMAPGIFKTLFGWLHLPPALMLWNGGMSFHGGILGVTIAGLWYARRYGLNAVQIGDLFSCVTPIGLFLGRIANFINAELYGRPWNGPWAMVFPTDPQQLARHPSQLYEAALEGVVLFIVVTLAAWRFDLLKRPGAVMGVFLLGYALSRVVVENFRQPDAHLPDYPLGLTMGMMLSLPMAALGVFFLWRAFRTSSVSGTIGAAGAPPAPGA